MRVFSRVFVSLKQYVIKIVLDIYRMGACECACVTSLCKRGGVCRCTGACVFYMVCVRACVRACMYKMSKLAFLLMIYYAFWFCVIWNNALRLLCCSICKRDGRKVC